MKIFALNLTCKRDAELSELMRDTLLKYGRPYISHIRSITTGGRDFADYYNGAGWKASMMKLQALDMLLHDVDVEDDDFVLSVDSDVLFTSEELFYFIKPEYGLIGQQHQQPYKTMWGPWGHMSGALIFIRGDIAKAMCNLDDDELHDIQQNEFKAHNIVENEDVVLSYLARRCGAVELSLPGHLSSGNFEEEVVSGNLRSFYHLNYCPTSFLGNEVSGKWDIPRVLKGKEIEL